MNLFTECVWFYNYINNHNYIDYDDHVQVQEAKPTQRHFESATLWERWHGVKMISDLFM